MNVCIKSIFDKTFSSNWLIVYAAFYFQTRVLIQVIHIKGKVNSYPIYAILPYICI